MQLDKLLENYKSVNLTQDADEKEWSFSPIAGKLQQVSLELNSTKCYDYACRYAIEKGAVAIIGYKLPVYEGTHVTMGETTGSIATVKEVYPKLALKKDHAVEVDFVFNPFTDKKKISQCVKFLSYDEQNYETTLQFDKWITPIRPIRYYIQRVMAAATILAHLNYAKPADIELAKKEILSTKGMTSKMNLSRIPSLDIGVDIADVQICDYDIKNVFQQINRLDDWFVDQGQLMDGGSSFNTFCKLDEVNSFINTYVHIGALSIMVRGGLLNLLKGYLSANPPIEKACSKLYELLKDLEHSAAYKCLKSYKI